VTIIDLAGLDPSSAYKLLIGIVIPRAIGWVSTRSVDGIANLPTAWSLGKS
jgi:flavin reductase (DIM6/NTAB) family NADH-FMN oxidoreductase RutF